MNQQRCFSPANDILRPVFTLN